MQQRINHLKLVEFKPLVEELSKIAAEELRLRAALTGEGFTDEWGIVHPPTRPA